MPYKNKEHSVERSRRYYQNNKEKIKEYQKQYRINNKKYGRDSTEEYFWHKYGITLDDYEQILQEQEFACAICRRHISKLSKPLFVDHDHSTGIVRGLLCQKCNTGLGLLGDTAQSILKALTYLESIK